MAIVRITTDVPSLVDLLPPKANKRRKVMRAIERTCNNVRHEDVYIRPADIANAVALPMNSVARTLRELSEMDVFEYIPPFRGRAIHVTNRKANFTDLEIDFTSLIERKAADYEKLRHVIRYATSEHCRQVEMLSYFRDPSAVECQTCDNCQSRGERPGPPTITTSDDRVLRTVRIALSGVARAKQRFGKQMIAAMLGGSRSAKITKWRLDELSTFGLLKSWPQTEIADLLDSMTAAGLFEQNEVDRFRPILKLTARGEDVMRGHAGLSATFNLPSAILRRIDASLAVEPKEKQADVSSSKRSALRSQHPGFDDQTSKAHIDSHDNSPGNCETSQPKSPSVADPDVNSDLHGVNANDDHVWTWRLADLGFSLDEIVATRRLGLADVLQHLSRAIDEGRSFDPEPVFPGEIRARFDQRSDSDAVEPIDSAHFHLYRKCLTSKKPTR
jgi:ATP-dependent DNA helicase RecQ